ncbi:TIGR04222 domain-containing membrane protein [Streptomyces sulphureus]|uniref:TIGR04222 domain-containing membrane protein n=1 Tax=Streptomyces sulphureus TaxID=47758 RepID=UPI00037CC578|nr:TIGR04222 domain-containing membrane protein [Streptomyces sulphureus]
MWVPLLVLAWIAALLSCARLCRVSAAADRPETVPAQGRALSLYETAYLCGGPDRVAEVALVSMARRRRVLVAHTGWATVVDPDPHDPVEESLIERLGGPGGQSSVARVRAALAAAEPVRRIGEQLAAVGLAVPPALRDSVTAALDQVRRATLIVLGTGVAAEAVAAGDGADTGSVAAWFLLPLVLSLGCMAIAHVEVRPLARWASPAGLRLVRTSSPLTPAPGDESTGLTAFAHLGPSTLPEPHLRAALGGDPSPLRG